MTVDPSAAGMCIVCSDPSGLKHYCPRCDDLRGIRKQLTPAARKARLKAMHEQWSPERHAFICKYTKVALNHNDGSAWHAEWEHQEPGRDESLVLAAAVINRMKGNMTLDRFKAMIAALHDYLNEGHEPFDESAFPRNWQPKRLATPESEAL
jgi:hypothetical protein